MVCLPSSSWDKYVFFYQHVFKALGTINICRGKGLFFIGTANGAPNSLSLRSVISTT